MRFEDALRELGVERGANSDAVRRAYLRLLKTRKPDVDPEGFKRLREAYEVLKGAGPWIAPEALAAMAPLARPEAPPEGESAARDASVAPDASEPSASEAPAPESPASEAPPPPAPSAPPVVTATPPLPPIHEIAALLEANKPIAASKRMRACFDAARTTPGVVLPSLGVVIGTLLRLHENGNLDSANSLYLSVHRWLEMTGAQARILGEALAVPWELVGELGELPATFDSKMRAALARSIREGNPQHARGVLLDMRVLDSGKAKEVIYLLTTRAPFLASALGDVTAPRLKSKTSFSWWWLWPVFVVISQIARFASSSHDFDAPRPRIAVPIATQAPPNADPWLTDAARSALVLANGARAEGRPEVQQMAENVRDALNRGNCGGAFTWLTPLRTAMETDAGPSSVLPARMAVLERSFTRACGSVTAASEGDAR